MTYYYNSPLNQLNPINPLNPIYHMYHKEKMDTINLYKENGDSVKQCTEVAAKPTQTDGTTVIVMVLLIVVLFVVLVIQH